MIITNNYTQDPLWQRIDTFPMDNPAAANPFSHKLAAEQGWTKTFTWQAISEYKRFIYLCCISPTGASPSKVVDEVWHMHLTYTTDYWLRFCKNTLERDIHHYPSAGGADEDAKHSNWYSQTTELYYQTFGEYPPEHIWPPAKQPDLQEQEQPPVKKDQKLWLLLIPFVLITLLFRQPNPYGLSGPHFLVFFAMLGICAALLKGYRAQDKSTFLKEKVSKEYHQLNSYEQAWLYGGDERVALLMVVELIDHEVIKIIGAATYSIDYEQLESIRHPLADVIRDIGHLTITSAMLKEIALNVARNTAIGPRTLKTDYEDVNRSIYLLDTGVIIVAVLRMMQGVNNGRPIGFLVMLSLIYGLVSWMVKMSNGFHTVCSRMLKQEVALPETPDVAQQVILYGIAPLLILPAYNHMRADYDTAVYGGGCSSGGGGCSGGGCGGGGCGGCGGS